MIRWCLLSLLIGQGLDREDSGSRWKIRRLGEKRGTRSLHDVRE